MIEVYIDLEIPFKKYQYPKSWNKLVFSIDNEKIRNKIGQDQDYIHYF